MVEDRIADAIAWAQALAILVTATVEETEGLWMITKKSSIVEVVTVTATSSKAAAVGEIIPILTKAKVTFDVPDRKMTTQAPSIEVNTINREKEKEVDEFIFLDSQSSNENANRRRRRNRNQSKFHVLIVDFRSLNFEPRI